MILSGFLTFRQARRLEGVVRMVGLLEPDEMWR